MNKLATRQKQILNFVNSAEYKKLDAFYSQPSIFKALGVSRHENTHSNFLAWLLTPTQHKNNHGLGDLPLRKLLETLALVCGSLPHSRGKLAPNIANAIISGGYTLSEISVEREYYIEDNRLDIYLKGNISFDNTEYPLTLVIENKVKSSENDTQTERYQAALKRSVSRSEILLSVYLTPLDNRGYESLYAPECKSKEFIQLNYQYLADFVITPCRNYAPEGSIKRYFDEYLLALGLPELRQSKGDIIMAISKEERDLLSRFWDKHKELLIAAMLSISDSDAIDDAEREVVQKASQALINVSQPDRTRYTWSFSGGGGGMSLPKNRLVLEIVAHYALMHAPISLIELKRIFPDELQGGTFGVFAPLNAAHPDNFKGYKRYMLNDNDIIQLSDGPIAVCNQWHKDNIKNFIACAEKLGYIINSTEQ